MTDRVAESVTKRIGAQRELAQRPASQNTRVAGTCEWPFVDEICNEAVVTSVAIDGVPTLVCERHYQMLRKHAE